MNEPAPSDGWPFLLRGVALFFIVEGVDQIRGIWGRLADSQESTDFWLREGVPLSALVVFHFLIGTLLLLRSSAGRVWAMIFLGAHMALSVAILVFQTPASWLAIGISGRLGVVLSLAVEAALIIYLNRPRVREFLSR